MKSRMTCALASKENKNKVKLKEQLLKHGKVLKKITWTTQCSYPWAMPQPRQRKT